MSLQGTSQDAFTSRNRYASGYASPDDSASESSSNQPAVPSKSETEEEEEEEDTKPPTNYGAAWGESIKAEDESSQESSTHPSDSEDAETDQVTPKPAAPPPKRPIDNDISKLNSLVSHWTPTDLPAFKQIDRALDNLYERHHRKLPIETRDGILGTCNNMLLRKASLQNLSLARLHFQLARAGWIEPGKQCTLLVILNNLRSGLSCVMETQRELKRQGLLYGVMEVDDVQKKIEKLMDSVERHMSFREGSR